MKARVWLYMAVLVASSTACAQDNDALYRQLGTALIAGQCDVVMQKGTTSESERSGASYVADNKQLHQCQYVQEISFQGCSRDKSCPSYEDWSKTNSDFTPKLPRGAFIAKLDERRERMFLLRSASSQK